LLIEGIVYRARLLDMTANPVGLLGELVMSADPAVIPFLAPWTSFCTATRSGTRADVEPV
jgi:hypothetical protein